MPGVRRRMARTRFRVWPSRVRRQRSDSPADEGRRSGRAPPPPGANCSGVREAVRSVNVMEVSPSSRRTPGPPAEMDTGRPAPGPEPAFDVRRLEARRGGQPGRRRPGRRRRLGRARGECTRRYRPLACGVVGRRAGIGGCLRARHTLINTAGLTWKCRANASMCLRFSPRLPARISEIVDSAIPVSAETHRPSNLKRCAVPTTAAHRAL
jgi:hypothetical protein